VPGSMTRGGSGGCAVYRCRLCEALHLKHARGRYLRPKMVHKIAWALSTKNCEFA
jgi:hypothetical protein